VLGDRDECRLPRPDEAEALTRQALQDGGVPQLLHAVRQLSVLPFELLSLPVKVG
jgi:hypothetical protein